MDEKEILIKYAGAMKTITDRLKSIMEEIEDLKKDLLKKKTDCEIGISEINKGGRIKKKTKSDSFLKWLFNNNEL